MRTTLPALVALFAWLVSSALQAETGERPNIVLILSDDHSYGDYSFMGHELIQTPHLEKLAHNGPEFADYFELRDLIATRDNDFARGFVEHLIEYGLGRPFGFTDEDLANGILAAAGAKERVVVEFVHALVQSEPFRTK